MKIKKAENVNFCAGNVFLKRIHSDHITSYGAIKKIAEDKNIDIFISKNKETKFLPLEDMFLVIATKEQPVKARSFFDIGKEIRHGASCLITKKQTSNEALGVKIYNATMGAIDSLEKKLTEKK